MRRGNDEPCVGRGQRRSLANQRNHLAERQPAVPTERITRAEHLAQLCARALQAEPDAPQGVLGTNARATPRNRAALLAIALESQRCRLGASTHCVGQHHERHPLVVGAALRHHHVEVAQLRLRHARQQVGCKLLHIRGGQRARVFRVQIHKHPHGALALLRKRFVHGQKCIINNRGWPSPRWPRRAGLDRCTQRPSRAGACGAWLHPPWHLLHICSRYLLRFCSLSHQQRDLLSQRRHLCVGRRRLWLLLCCARLCLAPRGTLFLKQRTQALNFFKQRLGLSGIRARNLVGGGLGCSLRCISIRVSAIYDASRHLHTTTRRHQCLSQRAHHSAATGCWRVSSNGRSAWLRQSTQLRKLGGQLCDHTTCWISCWRWRCPPCPRRGSRLCGRWRLCDRWRQPPSTRKRLALVSAGSNHRLRSFAWRVQGGIHYRRMDGHLGLRHLGHLGRHLGCFFPAPAAGQ